MNLSGLRNPYRSPVGIRRSVTAENLKGEPGSRGGATDGMGAACAKDLGQGWKISQSSLPMERDTFTLADMEGPGIGRHIWITDLGDQLCSFSIRFHWYDQEHPSVEVPLGD